MKFWLNLLISIDQFFNTVAGGNPDVTISAHVGLMASKNEKWQRLEFLIDLTFLPIQNYHCVESFLSENDFDETSNLIQTSIVAILGCALLYIPIRIIGVFKNG